VRALHGIWTSTSQLSVWAEDSDRQTRPAAVRAPRPHPFASRTAELVGALDSLGQPGDEAGASRLTLWLPSRVGAPLPSPELERPGGETRVRLRPWAMPALALAPDAALDLLLSLPPEPPSGLAIGDSLRFLAEVCKLALELVARGRMLPSLAREEGRFVARWRPCPEPQDAQRLRLLAAAMPPICRAQVSAETPRGQNAARMLQDLFDHVADAAARASLPPSPLPRLVKAWQPMEAWLDALSSADARVDSGERELASAERRLDAWRKGATPTDALRLCFRLVPPDRESAPWLVQFLLQAADDPSLLVPASEVWSSAGQLVAAGRVMEHPQERLLAELGRASRLWPGLEAGLDSVRPQEVTLDAWAAHRFLREYATVLAHSGFGVLVPPWWQEPQARLGLRLRARPVAGATPGAVAPAMPGRLGLEALCEYEWEVAIGDDSLTAEELRELARLKVPLVEVRGRWVELRPEELASALARLEDGGQRMQVADVLRVGMGLEAAGDLPVVGVEAQGWVGDLLARGLDQRLEPVPTPAAFHGELRPYQERGLAWLSFLGGFGLGACLADDMGLGKTVQMLALLLSEREGGADPAPTLLVCPMSVVGNWQREAERFAPSLKVHVHHGSERLAGGELTGAAASSDLVVTTYGLVVRDQEALAAVEWGRVVLDEAQNIKNTAARQTQAVRALRAPQRVALTGTPVENRLSELWSIMEFCNHGLLGSGADFRRRFAVPIERYREEGAADLLKRLTQPFVLRRLKTDRAIIADLPEKVEMKVYCNITREQATLYQAVLDDMLARIDAATEEIERRGLVLAAMTKLKQVLNHPAQFLRDASRLEGRSGKLARLEDLLEEVLAEGDRALVFTQYAEMGALLQTRLRERLGHEVSFLHGGTPKRARDDMVASFQSATGAPVFVLSLKAGGTGLNLTAANHVIHFDRWWNPAVEDQATDRAFRIGQRRDVQVRKFVCVGTLEERIDRMIEEKRELAERVVGTGEGWLTELSTAALRELVALSADAVAEA
jgi:SNF2-related domain/SNF2 Helicase protein/Helicase conserved C-terminal domain